MTWNTENPPKDGTPIVVIGRIIFSDELLTCVDPFTAIIFWTKAESGFEGWCLFENEYKMSVATSLNDKVMVDFWLELPSEILSGRAA